MSVTKASPLIGPGEPRLIDLGPSSLRSVSPIHIQYMKNMGVQASLVGSLVVDGRLWGHLSCHHESGPKYIGPAGRDAFGWACEDVAALLSATQARKLQAREHELAALRQNLVRKIRSADFESLMDDRNREDLLAAVGADGFAVVTGNEIQSCGYTPSADQIKRLQGVWKEHASDPTFFASSALARDLGDHGAVDQIAGAVFVSAPQIPEIALGWFRRERRYTVRWGGDPNHAHLTGADGRLTPRKSFDLFLQDIAGTSLDWTPEEQFSAKELASLIEIELLRKELANGKIREGKLSASEARFRMLVEEAPDAIMLYDADQNRLVSANRAAERLFGVSRDEIVKYGPQRFYAAEQPDGRPAKQSFSQHNNRALAGEEVTFERRVRRASGEERICRATLVRLSSDARMLRASLVDVTEQRAAEAQLSEVLRGTVVLQEAERQRIARELHDSLGQYLAASNMRLDIFSRSVPDGSALMSGIAELKSLMASAQNELGRLAWGLRPIALDDIGLGPAIQRLVDEWDRRSELQFDLHLALNRRRLPPEVETTLYRVFQEGITNIVKHADAGRVGVVLKATPDGVVLIIEDDGKGFEQENVNRGSSPRLGLLGMRERIAMIHGSLEIERKPGDGTTLIIHVPLNDSATP
jgi:PAS domain S-box-containing protein